MKLWDKIRKWFRKQEKKKVEKKEVKELKEKMPSTIEHKLIDSRNKPLRDRIMAVIEQDERLLSRPCCEITDESEEELAAIISDMSLVAHTFKKICVGLSANQVGHYVKICMIRKPDTEEFFFLINAKIIGTAGGRKAHFERCLSRVDSEPSKTKRWKEIWVEYYDPTTQKKQTKWFRNRLVAQTIQHEIDHGNGILV